MARHFSERPASEQVTMIFTNSLRLARVDVAAFTKLKLNKYAAKETGRSIS